MTYYELNLWFEGVGLMKREELELTAWQTAHILNCWSKRRITMHKLIGSRKGVVNAEDFQNADDFKAAVAQAQNAKQES
jgi:hypothetical protein